jgi:EpsI family protein
MNKNSKFIIVILVLLAGVALNHYFSKPDISLPRKSLAEFPKEMGDWTAISDQRMDDGSMRILQVDDYFARNYRNSKGEIIGLYIGYFKSQREGKGIHSPRQCLPGAGWAPVDTAVYQMKVPNHNPETVPVNKFVMGKGLDRQLYLFWYHGRGRIYASEYWNKIYLIWDGLTKKRTDGALIRVNNPVSGNTEDALKTQSDFIQLFFPLLKEYIPN